jgi:hypothetical protein
MNILLKLCGAGLACALLASGAPSASANVAPADEAAVVASATGVVVAINPQPLPPSDDE